MTQPPSTSRDARIVDLTAQTLEHYRLHAEICRVLADPKRLMVLDTLRDGERSVGELAAAIGTTLPNASQHLAVLRTAGLVRGVRSGTTVTYRLAEPAIVDACDIVHAIVTRRLAVAAQRASDRAAEAAILANRA
jgi:ArsR family transcriptional regulator